MKSKLFYLLVNFSGNGKYLKSQELQKRLFGLEKPDAKHDSIIRNLFRELKEDELKKDCPDFIFGSSLNGFQLCQTPEEIDESMTFLYKKMIGAQIAYSKYAKAYKRKLKKEFEPGLPFKKETPELF